MNTTKFEIYRNDLVKILDFDNIRHYIDDEAYSVDKQIEAYFKLYHPEYNIIFCAASGDPLSGEFSFAYSVVAKREDVLIHVMVHNDWDDCLNTVSEIRPLKNQNKTQTNCVH
jgi:hypothetical protein